MGIILDGKRNRGYGFNEGSMSSMADMAVSDRDSKGRFIAGVWSGGPGRPMGMPCKSSAVRQAFMDSFDLQLLEDLKKDDPRTFWQVFAKMMPQQVQAEVGPIGSIGNECQKALIEMGVTNGKTRLGSVPDDA